MIFGVGGLDRTTLKAREVFHGALGWLVHVAQYGELMWWVQISPSRLINRPATLGQNDSELDFLLISATLI